MDEKGYPPGAYAPPPQGAVPGQQPSPYHPQQQPGPYPPQQQTGSYPPQQQTSQYPPQQTQQTVPQYQQGGTTGGFTASTNQQTPAQWDPNSAQQFHGDTGQEDLDENASREPVEGSAPPPLIETPLPGYENVAFANEMSAGPPPSYESAIGEATTIDLNKMSSITDEEAREALLDYVGQRCCYGKGAANDMKINDIRSTSAFHYTLETFTESRSTKWHYVPYSGGFVDGPHMGSAPGPWDIICSFSALFQTEVKKLEVPHTASVRPCHICSGRGFDRCWMCHGRGRVRCSFCHGTGRTYQTRDGQTRQVHCSSCGGNGRKSCYTCAGTGCVRCRECKGFGQIKQYIQLTVNFSNKLSDHIVEKSDMPDHLIRDVSGDVILEQIALRVGPVERFMEPEINQQSHAMVNAHATSWPTEKILQQRQKLRAVPVYECDFKFKDKTGRFWVYGKQRAVFTEDYPHTCCCCCAIL